MKRLAKSNKKGYLDDDIRFVIIILSVLCLCIVGIIAILSAYNHKTTNDWNNGRCPNDGHEWVYIQAVGHKYSTEYIYACPDCGNKIEVDNEPNWREVAAIHEGLV